MTARRRLLPALLLCASASLLGEGTWIHAKGALAQALLHRAWARTLSGQTRVRPWPWADTWPVARLRIPSSGSDFIVLAGATGRTLAFGPGHSDGSGLPGAAGNCVVSAHRDTQFSCLRTLVRGDALVVETADGRRRTYRVEELGVMDRKTPLPPAPEGASVLTLVTCYPFDAIVPGSPLRYVVRAGTSP